MSDNSGGRPHPASSATVAWRRDLLLVLAISVVAVMLCARFNLSEALLRWSQPLERFQLDELPAILLVIAVCLVWFAARRYREACRELNQRQRAEGELREALASNRRLARQYLEIQEAERRALARDLHDELGQHLNAMKVDAVSVRERCMTIDAATTELAAAIVVNLDRVQGVVMGLVRQLRPVGLDELGLAAALEHCVAEWRRRLPGLALELSVDAPLERLDEMRRLALYRLVQEGLTNVARHAQASRVAIRIGREAEGSPKECAAIVAAIEDDGVGAAAASAGLGLGLIGMRERVEAVGGSLQLRAPTAGGFALRAHIPLGSAA
jgi:two-component system, NarL family, sensor histidine kinase UhpB